MGNTQISLPALSAKIYQEWLPKTVLVQSCDDAYEGEFNLETREIDIPVYHDLSIHLTTLKEAELKPASIEFVKASTKRVSIDKGRYAHWGQTEVGKLMSRLSAEDSEVRKKLVNKWAVEAEKELAQWCALLPSGQEIDLITALTVADTNANGLLGTGNVMQALDILKAFAINNNMEPSEFKFFVSEKFESVLRDSKLVLASVSADEAFRSGSVGVVNSVDIRRHNVASITTRNSSTHIVESEWGIWKTKDGIQYVVPYKNTVSYEISPTEVLMGGTGYQTVEYYDFFNLYPSRLYKVKIRYAGTSNPPTSF
ncbi:hypothetical protein [Methanoculleus sp.]|uniref:hypothetical protein n=1 Tax=Methanoculleus sp. TaxID=90427 RepID=UPI0025D3D774|nr:hypothetical protein [Methanoculleus sp.]MCK9320308.1 hypothetical protein [Methanoculleus sp.]